MSDLIAFATARRTARATLLNTWLAGGAFRVYSSPAPADADAVVPGAAVLLCTFTLADPAGAVTDGVWEADPLPAPAVALAEGTAAWGRACDAEGATIGDFAVGESGSGAFMELNSCALSAGFSVAVTAMRITEG